MQPRSGDEYALRGAVWAFVGTERNSGAPAGQVIMALLDLVSAARLPPTPQQARLRRVMLWCVEAYFGQLTDDVFGRDADAFADLPQPEADGMTDDIHDRGET